VGDEGSGAGSSLFKSGEEQFWSKDTDDGESCTTPMHIPILHT